MKRAALILVLTICGVHAAAEPVRGPDDVAGSAAVLVSPAASEADRARAARHLVQASRQPAALEAIGAAMRQREGDQRSAAALLAAIAAKTDPNPDLLAIVAERARGATDAERVLCAVAAGSFRTRESAAFLLSMLEGTPPVVREAAQRGLLRLSGRSDLVTNQDWREWYASVENLPEEHWLAQVEKGQARRADAAEAERAALVARLTESFRRLHVATPQEQRAELLATLMRDPLPELRSLGFGLVSRELSANGLTGAAVGDAAVALLSHTDPPTRASAAVVVRQVAPEGAARAVAAALENETDPRPAAELLLAGLRWETDNLPEVALRWLATESEAADEAAEVCGSLAAAGRLDQGQRARVLEIVRKKPSDRLVVADCSLLARLGNEEDRAGLAPLLDSPSAGVRAAAAEALIFEPRFQKELARAAEKYPGLYSAAVRSAVVNEPDAESFRVLRGLAGPGVEERRTSLLMLARVLPAPDLLDVSRDEPDADFRRALLSGFASEARVASESLDPAKLVPLAEGALLLAKARLENKEPDAAIAALDAVPFLEGYADEKEATTTRFLALLALGRVDLAAGLPVTLADWFAALEQPAVLESRGLIAAAMLDRFTAELNEEQRERLRRMAENAAGQDGAEDGPRAADLR